jgi:hypothetical protein
MKVWIECPECDGNGLICDRCGAPAGEERYCACGARGVEDCPRCGGTCEIQVYAGEVEA